MNVPFMNNNTKALRYECTFMNNNTKTIRYECTLHE